MVAMPAVSLCESDFGFGIGVAVGLGVGVGAAVCFRFVWWGVAVTGTQGGSSPIRLSEGAACVTAARASDVSPKAYAKRATSSGSDIVLSTRVWKPAASRLC